MKKPLLLLGLMICLCAPISQPTKTEYRKIEWRLVAEAEAEARAACVRPVEIYYTTSGANCYRTPTPQKNYCPTP